MPITKLFGDFAPPGYLGRYRLGDLLGYGGMGAVYKGWDEVLARHVAIKLWRPESASTRATLLAEAQLLARINHPGVVQVFDVVADGDYPAIVMEYIPGSSLPEYLSSGQPDVLEGINIACAIAAALAAAHSHGVVHRDLKPANVLRTVNGDLKLVDFGIACLSGEAEHSALVHGSITAMSPEQLRGDRLDQRSDIYSLGCLLYWLFCGQAAMAGELSSQQALHAIELRQWPSITQLNNGLPAGLSELIEQMMSFDVNIRPDSATTIIARLEVIKAGLSEQLEPDTMIHAKVLASNTGAVSIPGSAFGVFLQRYLIQGGAALAIIFVLSILLLPKPLAERALQSRSVAVVEPTVQNPEHVADVRLMKSAVFKAVLDGVADTPELEVITPGQLPQAMVEPEALAKELDVDEVIFCHMDCTRTFCNISLRRYAGGAVVELADVRVPLESYATMHHQLSSAVPRLYRNDDTAL
jgi:serine/threonine-protein kinase